MFSFGVLINGLGYDQLSLNLVNTFNRLVEDKPDVCPVIFFEEYYRPLHTPLFSQMPIEEAWDFPYPIVATNADLAAQLLSFPCFKKWFYVWNLEWIYDKNIEFSRYNNIYNNSDLQLIGRNNEYAKIMTKLWKEPNTVLTEDRLSELPDILF